MWATGYGLRQPEKEMKMEMRVTDSTKEKTLSREVPGERSFSATDALDWQLGQVTVSALAWREMSGGKIGNPEMRLLNLLWKFSRAKDAAAPEAVEILFRVPAVIRPGIWKRIPLVATRQDSPDGSPTWHVSLSH